MDAKEWRQQFVFILISRIVSQKEVVVDEQQLAHLPFQYRTAKDKKLFPDKHPYLPKSCASCPLNTERTLSRKGVKRDCTICDIRKKHFEIGKKIFPNDWHVILLENKKGGYLVVQDGHGADDVKRTTFDKNEISVTIDKCLQ